MSKNGCSLAFGLKEAVGGARVLGMGMGMANDRQNSQEVDEVRGHHQSIHSDLGWFMVPIHARQSEIHNNQPILINCSACLASLW
jgi:hypothetical protein